MTLEILNHELLKVDRTTEQLELNKKKWDGWARTLDDENRRNKFLRDGQRRVVSLLQLKPNSNFLDIGCGTGWALNLAAQSVDNSGGFYGVDLSLKMIEKAKQNYRGKENFHFVQADAGSIPLDGNFFDVIICTHSFHHYPRPANVMSEINRMLKRGGKVYILDPATDTLFGKLINRIIGILEAEHVKMYSTEEFRSMFASAGMNYVCTEAMGSIEKIHIAEK